MSDLALDAEQIHAVVLETLTSLGLKPQAEPLVRDADVTVIFIATRDDCWRFVEACRQRNVWPRFRFIRVEGTDTFIYSMLARPDRKLTEASLQQPARA